MWTDENCLKMSSGKTEVIIFGSREQVSKTITKSMYINGENIEISDCIKYLGVWADQHLTFKYHIKMKCKMAMWNLQKLKTVRLVLTIEVANTLAMGTIISHLDYCNSIYSVCQKQTYKNFKECRISAKTVLGKQKFADPTNCLRTLHWLPIKYSFEYKILCILFKCLSGEAPDYLKDVLHEYTPKRQGLQSEETYKRLVVPRTVRKIFASRAFSVYGLSLWNQIPNDLKELSSLDKFKKDLKTYPFNNTFLKNTVYLTHNYLYSSLFYVLNVIFNFKFIVKHHQNSNVRLAL